MASPLSFSSWVLILIMQVYQRVFSPLLGSCCRFTPTCSNYGIKVIGRFGVIKGTWLIMKRMIKCHPLHPGGEDPPPPEKINTREH